MTRGALLVLEGPEGVGKTTQMALLAESLRASGIPVLQLRDPGGTPVGEAVRSILLDPQMKLSAPAESLLFLASRAQLVADEILPALQGGTTVLLDRFFLSTYAYQIGGRGLDEREVIGANQLAVQGLTPDATVVLNLDVEEGMRRADVRSTRDRMELAGDQFHKRVESAFRSFVTSTWQSDHPECGRIFGVDASGSPPEVSARVSAVFAPVIAEDRSASMPFRRLSA